MANKVRFSGGPNLQFYVFTIASFLIWGWQGLAYWFGFCLFLICSFYAYFRYRHNPIITSLLDSDWYKFTMGQVVFHKFPTAIASYKFINRGKTQFPDGFASALKKEIKTLSKVCLTYQEANWLFFYTNLKYDYIGWLEKFRLNQKQVTVTQTGGDLEIVINGPWVETILWEVPLMAIVSELYFRMTGKEVDDKVFVENLIKKSQKLSSNDVKWIDFGTRRRFSKDVQNFVDHIMRSYKGFIGTSNPYFAMKYKLKPIGTYAHESVMAMQALYPPPETNRKWMEYWMDDFKVFEHRIALTDTLTTEVFLRDFDKQLAEEFIGVRQDSGDPFEFARHMIQHYKNLGIDPKTKKIVFSDSLDADKAIALQKEFGDQINCVMGIGTSLTNDCGHKPLNMVIKLTTIDFGEGPKSVVKLSDDPGKHTGDPRTVDSVKQDLDLCYS